MKKPLIIAIILIVLSGCKYNDLPVSPAIDNPIESSDTIEVPIAPTDNLPADAEPADPTEIPIEQSIHSSDAKNHFWDNYVYLDEMGKTAQELFSSLSTYYFVVDGVEVLYPYEDCVAFSGPAWETDSVAIIANYINRAGYDYIALIDEAYGDEAAVVYDDLYGQTCIVITDRGYELRFYYSSNYNNDYYIDFFEYRKIGANPPVKGSSFDMEVPPEIPDAEPWKELRVRSVYLGLSENRIPLNHDLAEYSFTDDLCTKISFSADTTWFSGKGIQDIKTLGIPFSLHGDEDNFDSEFYIFRFSNDMVVRISCSVDGDIGFIDEDSTISIYMETY